MRSKHAPKFVLLSALLAGASGCRAQRELVINSDPPGARIRLDDILLPDRTPARIPFKDYGVRRVTLYLDGYVTYSEAVEVKPPWYGYFPLDFLSEILIPVGWHDRHRLRVIMEPGDTRIESPDLVKVMQRADEMRHVGPNGPKLQAKQARTLPREEPGAAESPPPSEHPNPDSKPVNPPAGGGG